MNNADRPSGRALINAFNPGSRTRYSPRVSSQAPDGFQGPIRVHYEQDVGYRFDKAELASRTSRAHTTQHQESDHGGQHRLLQLTDKTDRRETL
jgi:hypothetical protein